MTLKGKGSQADRMNVEYGGHEQKVEVGQHFVCVQRTQQTAKEQRKKWTFVAVFEERGQLNNVLV